jgi:multidrug efflux pump subunit AcrA (membrane-fusion protein)
MRIMISKMTMVFILILTTGCSPNRSAITPTLVPTPVTVEKPVYTVERGLVEQVLQLTGRVSPRVQQDLYFRADGFVKEVLVQNGDWVTEGTVLARLDEPERYQADVASAELAYEQAKIKLEQTKLDAPIRGALAKIALLETQIALDKAKNDRAAMQYPRVTDGLKLEQLRGDVASALGALNEAQDAFDDVAGRPEGDAHRQIALQNLLDARQTYDRAVINLNWAEGKGTKADLDLADANVNLAQANYEKALAEAEFWNEDGGTTEIRLAELVVKDAETRLALATKTLGSIELVAPINGQVLSLSIVPGSQVRAFQAVITLADPAELVLMSIPAVEDLNKLAVGMQAVVRLSSQQGQEYSATISNIPLDLTSASELSSGNNAVQVTLNEQADVLRLGDAATILIKVDAQQDVLWLPPAAIRSFQGQDFVFVESGGIQRRVNVVLGLKANDRVEIVSGLEEGQQVVGQ